MAMTLRRNLVVPASTACPGAIVKKTDGSAAIAFKLREAYTSYCNASTQSGRLERIVRKSSPRTSSFVK